MAVLNITPDSFYDGARYEQLDLAVARALAMEEEGANIIDVGGESTRPGARPVTLQQELDRVIPVIEKLKQTVDLPISIDTSKPAVMEAAVRAGAEMVNDINGLREPGAAEQCARLGVSVCVMHMQGKPQNMQCSPNYPQGVVKEINGFFTERISHLLAVGLDKQKICLDPGFGFGKSLGHNYQIINRLAQFAVHGLPILVGLSRKSMIAKLLRRHPETCLAGSLAAVVLAASQGASLFRVHDVQATRDVLSVIHATKHYQCL